MPRRLTATRFLKTWKEVWITESRKQQSYWIKHYDDKKKLTAFMAGQKDNEKSFLGRVGEVFVNNPSLDISSYRREWYYVDFVYYGEDPLCPALLLEHENADNYDKIEHNMWKLCIYRSPLKVLVFYDWDKCDLKYRPDWLTETLRCICKFREQFDKFHEESPKTRYLFIVGDREGPGCDTRWRYAIDSGKLKLLTRPRRS